MATTKPTTSNDQQPLQQEPQAGGCYTRDPATGGINQVAKTEQPTGRTKASQEERERRLAESARQPAVTPKE